MVESPFPKEVICEVCGKKCRSHSRTRYICKGCFQGEPAAACKRCGRKRHNVSPQTALCPSCETSERRRFCAKCGKVKVIFQKSADLCRACYNTSLAPKELRKYVANFTIPYTYNQFLFNLLVAAIDWQNVTTGNVRKFKYIGRYLQTRQIREPLTWEDIDALLPEIGPEKPAIPKFVRAGLLDIGHLLAARGELERWDEYVAR